MHPSNLSIFTEVRYYRKLSQQFQAHLVKYPEDWPKFLDVFILTVNKIYSDIQQFEKENLDEFEPKVYKLKRIFEKRYRRYFLCGEFIKWSYDKPFGYAGDFKIIDAIYKNSPTSTGLDRLWDNYFQQLAISKAVRERKEDFRKIIFDFVSKNSKGKTLRIMNLACGPTREIKELLENDKDGLFSKVIFDCYDLDVHALDYAARLLNKPKNVNFLQKNALRIALRKDVMREIAHKYDLIYSTGLFDYLDENISVRLVSNLKQLLNSGGCIVIANMRDKFSNPSAGWMEWVAEWNLIYRTEAEFKKIFLDSGFAKDQIQIIPQKSNVIQYCFTKDNAHE